MKPLEDFLKPTQMELFTRLRSMYKGKTRICKNSYILVQGEAPVMLVAHLDTVHHTTVQQICKTSNGNILMSPQGIGGDDRCGVYGLVAAHEQSQVKPWLLFTCDEETGGNGANSFCVKYRKGVLPKGLYDLKLIIELDRKGKNDAVYYDCGNEDFEDYITKKGFKTASGSFSDISYIAPELGVAAVNLSSGYYNAHTLHEYINRKHLNETVKKVVEIISDSVNPDFPKYEYVEDRSWGIWGGWYDDYYTERVLSKIPEDIREEYEALLDYYSVDELEDCRAEHGDRYIPMLYESEFGDHAALPEKSDGWGGDSDSVKEEPADE